MAMDKTNQFRRVTFDEEVRLSDLDGSISYEQRNDSSDVSCETVHSISAQHLLEMVNDTTVSLDIVPGEEQTIDVQEAGALSVSEEAVETVLANASHASTEEFDEGMSEFEKTTLFSSKC